MMAKIMYPLGNILAIPLIISLWVDIISLPATCRDSQSDLPLVGASTRKPVREIDQTATDASYNSYPSSPVDPHDKISNTKRLILDRSTINETCQGRGAKIVEDQLIGETYLKNCFRYKLDFIISEEIFNHLEMSEKSTCVEILEEFVQLDETIKIFDDLFTELLSRYNCHNGYSVKWNCDDCKRAYKDWLCATHLPVYMKFRHAIKPCISFCERVEQRCPYLHPITREQYGGQPVFICRDPNIPFVPAITPDIPYSDPGKCYDLCHLNADPTELTIDSLSKYDYNQCPDVSPIEDRVQGETEHTLEPAEPTISDDKYESLPGRKVDARQKKVQAHHKKLMELLEVLANYKNQSKTHRYHADHSSIEHTKSRTTDLHQSS